MRPHVYLSCLLASLSFSTASATDQEGLLFHAAFEEGSDVAISQSTSTRLRGSATLTTGRLGHQGGEALQVGKEASGYVATEYPLEGNIDYKQGTIELWYRPDFSREDDERALRYLVAIRSKAKDERGGDRSIILAHTSMGRPFLRAHTGSAERREIAAEAPWQAGDWHHIALVWTEAEAVLYIDGIRSGTMPLDGGLFDGDGEAISAVIPSLALGGLPLSDGSVSADGLIDEVRIWNRPVYTDNFIPQ